MRVAIQIGYGSADVMELKDLIEAGKVDPVIDRIFRLGEIAEAFAYLDEGHARGKVVIAVGQGEW
jgi:NADPH:quinone reductase-like Zn-dependent oxidoreductase